MTRHSSWRVPLIAAAIALLSGCTAIAVTGAVVGAAVGVGAAVVGTAVDVTVGTGKAVVNAVSSDDDDKPKPQ